MVKYPGDWEIYEFDDVFHILPNNTLSRDKLTTRGNIGNIHYGDVLIKYGIILTANDDIPKIKPECESSAKIFLRKNDIIIADTAEDETVGKAVQIGDVDIPLVAGLHTIPCRPVMPTAPGYLGYYINSKAYHDQLLPYITGIKVSSISKASIRKTLIPLPTLKEQTAIADTLAAFDTHISNLTELISKKKAIREGALNELMTGRTRLKRFCGEWRDAKIGDILKILHGKDKRNVESPAGHYPILGTGGIIGKAIKPLCDWECVLIGRKGTIDRPYYMDKPFWSIDTLYYSKPEENQCVKYQYYLFCSINWYDYMESSGRPSLTRKAIENIKIKLPPLDEQTAIADTLTALDKEISSLEAERAKISNIRDGAMNDLLTGKVRLIHGNRKTAPEPRNSLADR